MLHLSILISLFFCHFLADFTWLSTYWILDAKRIGKPYFPIFVHATIHALLVFLCLFLFKISFDKLIICYLFELISHFVIDVLKGKMNLWFPYVSNMNNKMYWVVFGFDQFLHICVISMIYVYVMFN